MLPENVESWQSYTCPADALKVTLHGIARVRAGVCILGCPCGQFHISTHELLIEYIRDPDGFSRIVPLGTWAKA